MHNLVTYIVANAELGNWAPVEPEPINLRGRWSLISPNREDLEGRPSASGDYPRPLR